MPEILSLQAQTNPSNTSPNNQHSIQTDCDVRPLPCSSTGRRFILAIRDYTAHYPGEVALQTTDVNQISKELLRWSRNSRRNSGQGINFMSQLMQEVYRLLQIKLIRITSPDGRPCQYAKVNAKESCKERSQELGQAAPISMYSLLQRGPPSVTWLLSIQIGLWQTGLRTIGYPQRNLGVTPQ